MLFYSAYGFNTNKDERYANFLTVVKNYTPFTLLEIIKGFFAGYAEAYWENPVYVKSEH